MHQRTMNRRKNYMKSLDKTHSVIVTRDFNSRLRMRRPGDSYYLGNFVLGYRNSKAEILTLPTSEVLTKKKRKNIRRKLKTYK